MALIIFIASVFVPLLKLLILIMLLISTQYRWQWRPVERTRLFRLTEAVGRWSMLDIYVVTILVALVHFGKLANISAGLGSRLFCSGGRYHHVRRRDLRYPTYLGYHRGHTMTENSGKPIDTTIAASPLIKKPRSIFDRLGCAAGSRYHRRLAGI